MTILLVDDERDILEGMLAGIDFQSLGIEQVFTAESVAEAKTILREEQVDLLLTDIEMPGESGLELLEWLRRQDMQVVTMFCTSYANFDYAKKAVEMRSFYYYLKPIAYEELETHLAAAVEEVRKNRHVTAYQQMGEYWLKGQRENRAAFWTNLLSSVTPLAEVLTRGGENGIAYGEGDRFSLCRVRVMDREPQALPQWKAYGFRNVAEDLLEEQGLSLEALIPEKDGNWTLVLLEEGERSRALFEKALRLLHGQAEKLFHVKVNGYVFYGISLAKTRAAYSRLLEVDAQDVLRARPLVDAALYQTPQAVYFPGEIQRWADWLAAGQTEKIMEETTALLKRRSAENSLTPQVLQAFLTDVQQMVFSELDRRGINAHTLFNSEDNGRFPSWALDSVDRFQSYLSYLLWRAEEQMHFAAQGDTVVGRVKTYIQEHLGEEINRANVAKGFFLNPDYLARLFKKETGQTLGSYLLEQRILEAKKLLCQPGLPVGEIAQRVGYDNYSYFSQLFHEKTGMSPSQFRKRYGSR